MTDFYGSKDYYGALKHVQDLHRNHPELGIDNIIRTHGLDIKTILLVSDPKVIEAIIREIDIILLGNKGIYDRFLSLKETEEKVKSEQTESIGSIKTDVFIRFLELPINYRDLQRFLRLSGCSDISDFESRYTTIASRLEIIDRFIFADQKFGNLALAYIEVVMTIDEFPNDEDFVPGMLSEFEAHLQYFYFQMSIFFEQGNRDRFYEAIEGYNDLVNSLRNGEITDPIEIKIYFDTIHNLNKLIITIASYHGIQYEQEQLQVGSLTCVVLKIKFDFSQGQLQMRQEQKDGNFFAISKIVGENAMPLLILLDHSDEPSSPENMIKILAFANTIFDELEKLYNSNEVARIINNSRQITKLYELLQRAYDLIITRFPRYRIVKSLEIDFEQTKITFNKYETS